jgi:hypothetical protein
LIIADTRASSDRLHERFAWLMALAGVLAGSLAAWWYLKAGLTLSHYDAKAHLVVARRVIDSLTPGWKQIGAVWLPLPHLINLFPTQIDVFYRTGAFAVALSVFSFGVLSYACARLVLDATGSRAAAAAGLSVLVLNPDLLYLQATPMTEPLLLALITLSVAMLSRWVASDGRAGGPGTGLTLAAACLTRYEAWPVTAMSLALAAFALWRRGASPSRALSSVASLAAFPAVAILAFLVESRLTVGHWFVTGGFYVPDNPDTGRPFKTIGSIWWASHHLNGYGVLLWAVAGAAAVLASGLASRTRAASLVVLALAASAALPWYAFYSGHPFRFRYMIPLVPALAVWAGIGVGLTGRFRLAASALLLALVVAETRPRDPAAPMVLEAQLDRQHSRHGHGRPPLAQARRADAGQPRLTVALRAGTLSDRRQCPGCRARRQWRPVGGGNRAAVGPCRLDPDRGAVGGRRRAGREGPREAGLPRRLRARRRGWRGGALRTGEAGRGQQVAARGQLARRASSPAMLGGPRPGART